jgi:hypothetical protein
MEKRNSETFCGRTFNGDELSEIDEIVGTCEGLSRTELANTVCELFSWKRPTDRLKTVECLQFLEYLESKGIIKLLPQRKRSNRQWEKTKILWTHKTQAQSPITGKASQYFPLKLTRITTKEQRDLWYEYIDRYHYLGYQLPFGAQLRYFIKTAEETILGCFQFSSPAWKMSPRDKWIGWSDEQRKRNLQKIINNSRFLLFPWVRVKNLASSVLSLAVRQIPQDWQVCYNYQPVLVETLVDKSRFTGTCYKAANFIHVGTTTGRGRMDRHTQRKGMVPKEIYLYPLTVRFREELLG